MYIWWKKCNSNQKVNNDKCRCECKKHKYEKDSTWNPATCSCENGKYVANMYDSVITRNKTIELYDEESKTAKL